MFSDTNFLEVNEDGAVISHRNRHHHYIRLLKLLQSWPKLSVKFDDICCKNNNFVQQTTLRHAASIIMHDDMKFYWECNNTLCPN